MSEPSFEFWFSYPCEVTPSGMIGPDEELFTLRIDCASGDLYELTVCTDSYLARVRLEDRESRDRLHGQYRLLPDLVVANKDVRVIEQIVADLIRTQRLRPEWLIPDELTVSWEEISPEPADMDDSDDRWLGMPVSLAEEVGWSCCHGRPAA